LNTVNVQSFRNDFAQHYQGTLNVILMDNGSCQTAKSLMIPENLVCRFLPPYSPALNPIERLGQDGKAQFAWGGAAAIEALEQRVERIRTHYSHATIRSLPSYPYVVRAVNAVCS
jgi:DDE superfamily endonuclease